MLPGPSDPQLRSRPFDKPRSMLILLLRPEKGLTRARLAEFCRRFDEAKRLKLRLVPPIGC